MANEHQPPNPYAPTDALTHAVDADGKPAAPGHPSRVGAFFTALLCYGAPGPGFYLLRRRRHFIGWLTAGILAWALLIAAVRLPLPKVVPIALVLLPGLWLTSLIATAVAKPAGPRLAYPVLTALLMIAVAISAWIGIRVFLVEAFQIPSGAMIPTLLVGDHIMVKKGRGDVQRGDVIVFKFPADHTTDYIKRVVAVGGDTIEVRDGVPSINGTSLDQQPIDQPCSVGDEGDPTGGEASCKFVRETNAGRAYTIILNPDRAAMDHPRTVVPPGELFVMGDNRDNSYDSRRWGTVKEELVKGKATVIHWSKGRTDVRWPRVGHGIE